VAPDIPEDAETTEDVMKRRLFAVLAAVVMVLALAAPALAIPLPDSAPSIDERYAYRNLLETGDMLLVVKSNLPYATPPTTTVSQAYVWRLFSADGLTEYGSTTGYSYHNYGYGYNVWSMYFPAATAPAWGGLYNIRLSGNPTAFSTPPVYNFYMLPGDYSSLTATDDVKTELATRVIFLANDLNTKWAALSLYGESFFRGAIYGLQAMAPAGFQVIVNTIAQPDRTWTPTFATGLTNQYNGWLKTAQDAGKELFKTDYDLLSMIICLALTFGVVIANMAVGAGKWDGLIDATLVLVFSARLGLIGLGYIALFEALCILYIGIKLKKEGVFG
jgi:hypothetical protein